MFHLIVSSLFSKLGVERAVCRAYLRAHQPVLAVHFAPCRKNLRAGVSSGIVGVSGILVEPLYCGLAEAGDFACKAHRDGLAFGVAVGRRRGLLLLFRGVDPLGKGDGVALACGEEAVFGLIQLLGEFVLAQYGLALVGYEVDEFLDVLFGA